MDSVEVSGEFPKAVASIPTEAFACPACGQMLAPSCRVCVACKTSIDPGQIKRPEPEAAAITTELPDSQAAGQVRFSWRIFFHVLALWLLAAILTTQFMGPKASQVAMGGLVLASSMCVFFDAQSKGVPKPLRWVTGCLLLWIVVFPWYLARRRTPQASCAFIEGEVGPVARVLFFVLMLFLLASALSILLNGPAPK